MHSSYRIRPAIRTDADALTRLAFLSKAHWGYPQAWIDLWRDDLTVTPEIIDRSIAYVADIDGAIIGFWSRTPETSNEPTAGWLFVHPDHMGRGIAKALWHEVRREAAARGIHHFIIEADPHAVSFYESLGAEHLREKESSVIPGRMIPLLRLPV